MLIDDLILHEVRRIVYLIWIGRISAPVDGDAAVVFADGLKRLMEDRRTDTVEPRSSIGVSGCCEGGARQLLSVEAVRADLRRVLTLWQRAGAPCIFASKFVAKTRQVLPTVSQPRVS